LNRARDISGNLIYVGGPGDYTTLKGEMDGTAGRFRGLEEPDASTDVSRIETLLGVTIGIVIAVAVLGVGVWWWFNRTEAKYNKAVLTQALSYIEHPNFKKNLESLSKSNADALLNQAKTIGEKAATATATAAATAATAAVK
jgi:cytoskeletal protein RodZ